jgi:hypothetical protein
VETVDSSSSDEEDKKQAAQPNRNELAQLKESDTNNQV